MQSHMTEQEKRLLYNQIGKNIRGARENLKIKQTDFAKLLEISRASVVNIEKARQYPPLHLIFDIAKALKVKVTDLVPEPESIDSKQIDKSINPNIRSYISKWIKKNEPEDAKDTITKIEEFIQENKS
jgi:DNA-binding XRE family transcriptional regulator